MYFPMSSDICGALAFCFLTWLDSTPSPPLPYLTPLLLVPHAHFHMITRLILLHSILINSAPPFPPAGCCVLNSPIDFSPGGTRTTKAVSRLILPTKRSVLGGGLQKNTAKVPPPPTPVLTKATAVAVPRATQEEGAGGE